eukprot:2261983-Prymnesium_polylepis.1
MTGPEWERRRARAANAFQALTAADDPQDLVAPWDSISNIMPAGARARLLRASTPPSARACAVCGCVLSAVVCA